MFVHVCTCVCMCMWVSVYTRVPVCACICVYLCVRMCTYVYLYVHMYMYVPVCARVYVCTGMVVILQEATYFRQNLTSLEPLILTSCQVSGTGCLCLPGAGIISMHHYT